jgi:hypothetical protein
MGYHTREIDKGTYGLFSKIKEEFEELEDAHEQGANILELCEFSDLYGAVEEYIRVKHNMSMDDIKKMSDMTKSAFKEGKR